MFQGCRPSSKADFSFSMLHSTHALLRRSNRGGPKHLQHVLVGLKNVFRILRRGLRGLEIALENCSWPCSSDPPAGHRTSRSPHASDLPQAKSISTSASVSPCGLAGGGSGMNLTASLRTAATCPAAHLPSRKASCRGSSRPPERPSFLDPWAPHEGILRIFRPGPIPLHLPGRYTSPPRAWSSARQ